MKIAILDDYQNAVCKLKCFGLLNGFDVMVITETIKDTDRLASLIRDAEVLVLIRERTEITAGLLDKLPNLKLISQTGKISNHINPAVCSAYNVAIAEGVGSPVAPAELAWALLMNTLRKIPEAIEGMKKGQWQTNIGTSVNGKTIGIWGYGKIGQRMARYARAFDANVLVWGSEQSRSKAVDDGFEQAGSKGEFFEKADVVSLHLRLNDATRGIVTKSDLLSMKENAVLINTARAELIEQGALLSVLKSGKNIFAGLDVYDDEPVYDSAFELLHMNNVVCTPHLGYVEINGYELYFRKAFENVLSFAQGNPVNIANPEAIRKK